MQQVSSSSSSSSSSPTMEESRLDLPSIYDMTISDLSWLIRQKPDWWLKCRDPTIVARWREEMAALQHRWCMGQLLYESEPAPWFRHIHRDRPPHEHPRPADVDFVLDQLQFFARVRELLGNKGGIGPVPGIVYLDNAVEECLRAAFATAVERFQAGRKLEDWHPGSGQTVLDIVHPSLYCYVEGNSPIITRGAPAGHMDLAQAEWQWRAADTNPVKPLPDAIDQVGKTHWIPAVFRIADSGQVDIRSYINNLDPAENGHLYKLIARIFERLLPGVQVLLGNPRRNLRVETEALWECAENYESEEDFPAGKEPFTSTAYSHEEPKILQLGGTDLYVIVKIASIHLTPERPRYAGGSWHLEGDESEAIVAAATYYYDMHNVTASRLDFRQFHDKEKVDRGVHSVGAFYGVFDEHPALERLPSMDTVEGRALIWANNLQHRVPPFELLDPTRSGYRKMVAFFIVRQTDVHSGVVPPQQPEFYSLERHAGLKLLAGRLGQVVAESVAAFLRPETWTWAQAQLVRDALMDQRRPKPVERQPWQRADSEQFSEELLVSLCEH